MVLLNRYDDGHVDNQSIISIEGMIQISKECHTFHLLIETREDKWEPVRPQITDNRTRSHVSFALILLCLFPVPIFYRVCYAQQAIRTLDTMCIIFMSGEHNGLPSGITKFAVNVLIRNREGEKEKKTSTTCNVTKWPWLEFRSRFIFSPHCVWSLHTSLEM